MSMPTDTFVRRATRLLQQAEAQFRFYGEQHRAKGTPEADAKAEVNEKWALNIRTFLEDAEAGITLGVLSS